MPSLQNCLLSPHLKPILGFQCLQEQIQLPFLQSIKSSWSLPTPFFQSQQLKSLALSFILTSLTTFSPWVSPSCPYPTLAVDLFMPWQNSSFLLPPQENPSNSFLTQHHISGSFHIPLFNFFLSFIYIKPSWLTWRFSRITTPSSATTQIYSCSRQLTPLSTKHRAYRWTMGIEGFVDLKSSALSRQFRSTGIFKVCFHYRQIFLSWWSPLRFLRKHVWWGWFGGGGAVFVLGFCVVFCFGVFFYTEGTFKARSIAGQAALLPSSPPTVWQLFIWLNVLFLCV